MTTVLLTHPACLEHVTPYGHPERVDRLKAILAALKDPDFDALDRREAPRAPDEAILRAHDADYLAEIKAVAPEKGMVALDADTSMSPGSLEAAYRAAGAVVEGVDLLMSGAAGNVFCAIRPPGHHAERDRAMGFCLFSNAAIAALHAVEAHGLNRVAIMDFDVHHGNGSQHILQAEPRVMYTSTHQWPLYPGTGAARETGVGNIVNAPLPAFAGSDAFRAAMNGVILPAIDGFAPELVIISAGFDAHRDDPLANLRLVEDDFAWATERLCDIADDSAGGRVLSTLEGGYDLQALARSTAAHVKVLMRRGGRDG